MQQPYANQSVYSHMKRYSFLSLLVVLGMSMGHVFTSAQEIFLGLLLGYAVSYANLWTTYYNARRLGHTSSSSFSMLFIGLGYMLRILLVLTVVGLALLYPDTIHLVAVVVGIGLFYVVMMVDMIIKAYRRKR